MQDVNVSNDLRQLSLGQVKTLEYSRYDTNGYCIQTTKLEASRPLAATTNSGLVTSGKDAIGHVIDYTSFFKILLSTHSVVLKS
jgi:hypothetical protein